ncbi:MAG: catalase, partial [Rhizobiaceae bacterium]|nr:catalase [Rhizobiaceae bacterium]
LVETVAGSLLGGVREPVLGRAFNYWKSVDKDVGRRIEEKVRSGNAPKPAEGMGDGRRRLAGVGCASMRP